MFILSAIIRPCLSFLQSYFNLFQWLSIMNYDVIGLINCRNKAIHTTDLLQVDWNVNRWNCQVVTYQLRNKNYISLHWLYVSYSWYWSYIPRSNTFTPCTYSDKWGRKLDQKAVPCKTFIWPSMFASNTIVVEIKGRTAAWPWRFHPGRVLTTSR